jgi:CRISPR/Cas system-associated protein Cas10 (large subunit of type III CRISPR-Cas system)
VLRRQCRPDSRVFPKPRTGPSALPLETIQEEEGWGSQDDIPQARKYASYREPHTHPCTACTRPVYFSIETLCDHIHTGFKCTYCKRAFSEIQHGRREDELTSRQKQEESGTPFLYVVNGLLETRRPLYGFCLSVHHHLHNTSPVCSQIIHE